MRNGSFTRTKSSKSFCQSSCFNSPAQHLINSLAPGRNFNNLLSLLHQFLARLKIHLQSSTSILNQFPSSILSQPRNFSKLTRTRNSNSNQIISLEANEVSFNLSLIHPDSSFYASRFIFFNRSISHFALHSFRFFFNQSLHKNLLSSVHLIQGLFNP